MTKPSTTTPSTRRLSEVARHVVIPDGIVTTGWPAVEQQCRKFGDVFDEWQRGLGAIVLGRRADGIYAATVGGVTLSIPRQVAKTFIVGRIVFALCVLFPGLRVVWSAHRVRTSTNTFQSLVAYSKRKKVAPYMAPTSTQGIRKANGEQEIAFANGSVILFGARESGFGRGFDEIDIEVFDEAQILTEKALEDMIAATNQSRHPHGALLFFMGTPPRPIDPGEVFTARRNDALSGSSEDSVYIECSADAGADPDDREQWAIANPSYPNRTPLRSMLRLRKNLPSVESWMREGLGMWDIGSRDTPMPAWPNLVDPTSVIVKNQQWALAVSEFGDEGGQWAALGKAGRNADGKLHLEFMACDVCGLARCQHRVDTTWVLDTVAAYWAKNPIPIRIRRTGPENAFIALIRERLSHDAVVEVSGVEAAQATQQLILAAQNGQLAHLGQPSLDKSVAGAVLRMSSDGAVVFSQRKSSVEITPLLAVAVAAGGVAETAEYGGGFHNLADFLEEDE